MLYLTREQVLKIHQVAITTDGGHPGLRDSGLLDAALALPESSFDGKLLHPDLPAACAAYLYHICQNHPFIDGNKRAAAMSAYVFANGNGYTFDTNNEEFEQLVQSVASERTGKDVLISILRTVLIQSI